MSEVKSDMKSQSASETRKVGKVKDAHSLKGELYVLIFSGDFSWLPKLKIATLIKPTGQTTIEIINAKKHKDGLIVKCKELTDRTAAEKWKGAEFEIPSELLVAEEGEDIYLSEIEGFEVHDKGVSIGRIDSFLFNGSHDLLVVQNEALDKEYEIPFVEEFIVDIDYEKEIVLMDLPEGLLEVND